MQADLFKDGTQYFGMFTDAGNKAVHTIVMRSRLLGLTWSEVYRQLEGLSSVEGCEEAMDTEVREAVYCALDFYAKGEDFYGA